MMRIELTLEEPLLGVTTSDGEPHQGGNCFYRQGLCSVIWDFDIKGYLKNICRYISTNPEAFDVEETRKLKSPHKVIDGLLLVAPRMMPLVFPKGKSLLTHMHCDECYQTNHKADPIRESYEAAPIGTTIEFTVVNYGVKGVDIKKCLREWLDYGVAVGLFEHRRRLHGTFSWKEVR